MIICRFIHIGANGVISLFLWLSDITLCVCVCVYIYIYIYIYSHLLYPFICWYMLRLLLVSRLLLTDFQWTLGCLYQKFLKRILGFLLCLSGKESTCQCRRCQVRSLIQEDPTCPGATKLLCHNYWACAKKNSEFIVLLKVWLFVSGFLVNR